MLLSLLILLLVTLIDNPCNQHFIECEIILYYFASLFYNIIKLLSAFSPGETACTYLTALFSHIYGFQIPITCSNTFDAHHQLPGLSLFQRILVIFVTIIHTLRLRHAISDLQASDLPNAQFVAAKIRRNVRKDECCTNLILPVNIDFL